MSDVSQQPYITKAYFGRPNPPVNLTRIAIGDGSLGTDTETEILPTVQCLHSRLEDGSLILSLCAAYRH